MTCSFGTYFWMKTRALLSTAIKEEICSTQHPIYAANVGLRGVPWNAWQWGFKRNHAFFKDAFSHSLFVQRYVMKSVSYIFISFLPSKEHKSWHRMRPHITSLAPLTCYKEVAFVYDVCSMAWSKVCVFLWITEEPLNTRHIERRRGSAGPKKLRSRSSREYSIITLDVELTEALCVYTYKRLLLSL